LSEKKVSCTYKQSHITVITEISGLSVPNSPLIAKAYDAGLIKVTDISDGVVGDLSTFRGEPSSAGMVAKIPPPRSDMFFPTFFLKTNKNFIHVHILFYSILSIHILQERVNRF
jgi:hypothetical protein